MKRLFSLLLCAIMLYSCCVFPVVATDEEMTSTSAESRATGLIMIYGLRLSVTGTTLKIQGETDCIDTVVKCGFKNFVIQRKKVTDSSWSDYYDYGNLYNDSWSASVNTTLTVPSGYQYRISCKHYAKKSLLVTQSVSNTSNVVAV